MHYTNVSVAQNVAANLMAHSVSKSAGLSQVGDKTDFSKYVVGVTVRCVLLQEELMMLALYTGQKFRSDDE